MTTMTLVPIDQWAQGEDRSNFQKPGEPWTGDFWCYTKATEACPPHAFYDPTFNSNWQVMRQEGKRRGAYHFYHPSLSPVDQAHFFFSVVSAQGIERGDFFVADIEITSGLAGAAAWHAPEAVTRSHLLAGGALDPVLYGVPPVHAGVADSSARIFLDTLAGLVGPHHAILVYSNLSVAATLGSCTAYSLLIAYPSHTPPSSVSPWPDFIAWQYGFGTSPVGGDQDKFHGSEDEMDAWIATWDGGHHTPPPPPPDWEEIMMNRLPTLAEGADDAKSGTRFVHRIQALLCAMGHQVKMDGIYGPNTKAAVEALQHAHGISEDGVTGPDTWSVLVTGAPVHSG